MSDTQEQQELEELSDLLKKLPTLQERCQLLMSWVRSHRVTTWQFMGLLKLCDDSGFDLAVQHLEAQLVTWRMTPLPPEVILDQSIKGVKALRALTLNLK